ncbi:MAG: DUF1080 domain-containing protein [Planctomycetaceae bacterium]|nr:DUF1080 domain-containing protein [Planctomycetaceae bacterium]
MFVSRGCDLLNLRPGFWLPLCCCLLMIEPVRAQEKFDDLAVRIFDGISLNGWDADPEYWRVENGSIVGEIPQGQSLNYNTWIVWAGGELKDFDLRLQVKLTGLPAANSGIQFRCQVDNVNHVSGYQADLDMGATWLGRIYDEHGRALIVERGTRVRIDADGKREVEQFAPADQYAVLFRENAWNDYRIVGIGDHIAVYINGTLFAELQDQQTGEQDLSGKLAFQLHSGPETRVEFRNVRVEHLKAGDARLKPFSIKPQPQATEGSVGVEPKGPSDAPLNLGFESGSLAGWKVTGTAFDDQPVNADGISQRWPGQISNKQGQFFIGGYEKVQDRGTGTLTSAEFPVTHPYGSFLFGGGQAESTRAEVIVAGKDGAESQVVASVVGQNREQMRRVAVDLRKHQGKSIFIRLVDENPGAWGHLNFDDFRFHDEPPVVVEPTAAWRSTLNPLLQHLVPNPVAKSANAGHDTIAQMAVPSGFSVDVVAAEPDLHQPMAFTFDAKGRLWVVEGYCYPQRRSEGEGLDRVLIFTDTDLDGSYDDRKVFIEGLNLVSGMEVGHGGVWIGAAPQLLFIPDRDGDDHPDGPPQILLDGFGYADTHETINSFLWGPDGWLYGNQGVFNSSMIGKPGASDAERQQLSAGVWRYHPVRHEFEVFAHGGSNQWGLDYDLHGQLFMTHCRSFWGRGATTHVMQGGHYWNQVNAGYAPFVSASDMPGLPHLKNYLLASARYGHGEGGAGKPGSRQVYGGHSHVGTMLYLGDNWPPEYRNHLFTHNLHGHQLNQQVNERDAGGYNTVHAGSDVLFCADQQYIGVDLQYGPDGAVYISDWYDPRHCHNPNVEQWDRGNGRMYRMKFDVTWKPVAVDYSVASDLELAEAQLHANDWHVRAARLELSHRATQRDISGEAVQHLKTLACTHSDADRRLRGLWTLHTIGQLSTDVMQRALRDDSEYVRAWAVQLATEQPSTDSVLETVVAAARLDESLFVQRYLASSVQRLPVATAWQVAESLASRDEIVADRDLPSLLWFGVARLMQHDLNRAMQLADTTPVASLRDNIQWYAARRSDEGREVAATRLKATAGDEQLRLLSIVSLAVRDQRGLRAPADWLAISESLYDSPHGSVAGLAESIGAAFGDGALYERMRRVLESDATPVNAKKQAISILASDSSPMNLPLYLQRLDEAALAGQLIPQLARSSDIAVADALISRLASFSPNETAAAMQVICSRVAWAERLLDAIAAGRVQKSQLNAFYVRQLTSLQNEQLNQRIENEWGRLSQTSAERKTEIRQLANDYRKAPLWAYNGGAGAEHFRKLCANCHQPNQQNEAIAPRLAGTGSKGIDYIVENVVDPNAVVGRDFQARIIVTEDGQVITGLVERETETSLTIRTLTESITVPVKMIEEMKVSENSFMPEGLLKTLNDRERIELFKYLMEQ